ncbi:MAG: penicillin-binding protein 1C [Rhodospirillaceae bacterium]
MRGRILAPALMLAGLGLGLTAIGLDTAYPPALDRLAPSQQILAGDGSLLRAYLTPDGAWRLRASAEHVHPLYLEMLQTFEDKRFPRHPGVDPIAILRATGQWIKAGEVVSGASTLTMQAARLLEPGQPRTLRSKAREALRAVQLEAHLGKDGVLAAYLSLAPFGGNLEGVRAGSLAWFGKEPKHLTPGQAALLVALPQSPESLRPDRHPQAAKAARAKVLDRALGAGVITARQHREALEEPIPTARLSLPLDAPQLADRLHRTHRAERVQTLIDPELQRSLQTLLRDQLAPSLDPKASAAITVMRLSDGALIASVGGVAYLDQARAGAMDLTRAVRSPGSALKPALYGLAFEDRVLHPETLISDSPRQFGAYHPTNFRQGHAGEVTAREALIRSLNLPAVAVLDRIGPLRMAERLTRAGVALHLPASTLRPGLPLALGGVGVTLEDMTALYAALGTGGAIRPLRLTAQDPLPEDAGRFLDPAAAWYVADILRAAPRPDGIPQEDALRPIAFKTGTSYGFRDSWTFGFDDRYAVGVWVGRPDGTPSPGQYGRITAAPVLFDVFARLHSLTRQSLGPYRPRATKPPPGVFLGRTGELPLALQRLGTTPSERGFLPGRAAGATPARTLALDPLLQQDPLTIAFPPNGAVLDWSGGDMPETVTLSAQGGQRPLRWLVDGAPLASKRFSRSAPWLPSGPGETKITVLDATGRAMHATIEIRVDAGIGSANK